MGRACVERDLATVKTVADLRPALSRIVDSYYRMFLDEPVMRDIWQATQADRALQKLVERDPWPGLAYPPAPGIPKDRGTVTIASLKDATEPERLVAGVDRWARAAWLACNASVLAVSRSGMRDSSSSRRAWASS